MAFLIHVVIAFASLPAFAVIGCFACGMLITHKNRVFGLILAYFVVVLFGSSWCGIVLSQAGSDPCISLMIAACWPTPVCLVLVHKSRYRPPPPFCPECGYDLTGNESGVCPECGRNACRNPPDHSK